MTVPLPRPGRDNRRMRAILVLVAAVAFPMAAVVLPPFTGYAPDAFPVPQLRPPVQPAGFAFSIWGLIYLGLVAHAAFGLFARGDDGGWDAMRIALAASLILGTGWIAIALHAPVLATLGIFAMLALALAALRQAPGRDIWLSRAPVALYAGWLTAASFVSLGLLVGGYGLAGSNAGAALAVLPLAILFAAAVQWWLGRVPAYAAGAGWGLFGIAAANAASNLAIAGLAGAGIAALAVVLAMARDRRPGDVTRP
ncbi:MAG: hypothetical protein ACK4OP_10950 [Gemmobacter sp.]